MASRPAAVSASRSPCRRRRASSPWQPIAANTRSRWRSDEVEETYRHGAGIERRPEGERQFAQPITGLLANLLPQLTRYRRRFPGAVTGDRGRVSGTGDQVDQSIAFVSAFQPGRRGHRRRRGRGQGAHRFRSSPAPASSMSSWPPWPSASGSPDVRLPPRGSDTGRRPRSPRRWRLPCCSRSDCAGRRSAPGLHADRHHRVRGHPRRRWTRARYTLRSDPSIASVTRGAVAARPWSARGPWSRSSSRSG